MGTIRDRILKEMDEERSRSTGPKTAMGNYNKIEQLKKRVKVLEETVDELEERLDESE